MIHDQTDADAEVTGSTPLEDHPVIVVARVVLGCAAAVLAVVASMNPQTMALWGFSQAVPHLAEIVLTPMLACCAMIGSVWRVSSTVWQELRKADGAEEPTEDHAHA
jgi:hypothetical protein